MLQFIVRGVNLVCLQREAKLEREKRRGERLSSRPLYNPVHIAQQQITKNRHRLLEAMRSGIGEATRSAPHGSCCGRRSAKAQRAPSWTVERGLALLSQLAGSEPQSSILRGAPLPANALKRTRTMNWSMGVQS